jgi:hypothetical protein
MQPRLVGLLLALLGMAFQADVMAAALIDP